MKLSLLSLMLLPLLVFGNIGTISGVKGKSNIHRANKIIKIKNGATIKVRDSITTAKNSKVQVIMKDKTIITIGANSEYSFDTYTYGNGQKPKVSMELKRGFFRVITGKISKIAPKRFHIKTRSATIGIRGTHFYGEVKGSEENIGCISGTIIVDTKIKTYLLNAGHNITLHNGLWSMAILPKAPKAKRIKGSKKVENRDILIHNTGINIKTGSTNIPTPPPAHTP
ncbi:MAG: FecR family protein [Sulfurovum sp.]